MVIMQLMVGKEKYDTTKSQQRNLSAIIIAE